MWRSRGNSRSAALSAQARAAAAVEREVALASFAERAAKEKAEALEAARALAEQAPRSRRDRAYIAVPLLRMFPRGKSGDISTSQALDRVLGAAAAKEEEAARRAVEDYERSLLADA